MSRRLVFLVRFANRAVTSYVKGLDAGSTVQTVMGSINYSFSCAEQRESKSLWTDYQSKLAPETEIVCVVPDGQLIQSPATVVLRVES
jgi:hypothetical protein